jgi:hypothetical protein
MKLMEKCQQNIDKCLIHLKRKRFSVSIQALKPERGERSDELSGDTYERQMALIQLSWCIALWL